MNRRAFLGNFTIGLSSLTFSGKFFSWLFKDATPETTIVGWTVYEEPGMVVMHDYSMTDAI